MRDDIHRIRALISEGKTDAEIMLILRSEEEADHDLGWSNPPRMFKGLARTMRRAVREERGVAATEVLRQLALFRALWEEIAANGDVGKVETGVLHMLCGVTPASSIAQAYATLFEDMSWLAASAATLGAEGRAKREVAERKYLRDVASSQVVWLARVASAVADASFLAYSTLRADGRYRALLTEDVLLPCVDLLVMHRPTLRELLRDADTSSHGRER